MSESGWRAPAPRARPGPSACGYSLAVRTGASQALNPGSNPGGRTRPLSLGARAPGIETYLGARRRGSSVRPTPRARRLLAALVAALFLPALPLAPALAAPTPLASTPVDLSLWLHADDTLSMAGNANDPP